MQDVGLTILSTAANSMSRSAVMTHEMDKTTAGSILKQLPNDEVKATKHMNVLFVFDDVVG